MTTDHDDDEKGGTPRFKLDPKEAIAEGRLFETFEKYLPQHPEAPNPCTREDVIAEARRAFGNSEKADRWLNTPKARFSGRTPLDISETDAGAQSIMEWLALIDDGLFE